jgi:ankyrin repeat protein
VGLISSFARTDLNSHDKDGITPILAAAYSGSCEIVRLLAGMPGIDLEVRDSAGVLF